MKFLFLTLTLSCITLPLLYSMTPDELLYTAVEAGNIQQAQEALSAGVRINSQNNKGYTLLHYAIRDYSSPLEKFLSMIKFLLNSGANVNIADNSGSTPLHDAVFSTPIEVVKILLDAGADLNTQDHNSRTPLHIAALYGFTSKVKLLESHLELLEKIKLKPTKELLVQAIDLGYVHGVKLLLKAGIKPDLQNLIFVKTKCNQDTGSLYKESYATIGRILLQHLSLTGELQAPQQSTIAKFYRWIMSLFRSNNISATEHAYGPISKSGLGLPKDIVQTIASFTH